MKKTKIYASFIAIGKKLFPHHEVDVKKNANEALNSILYSEFELLSTRESIIIFDMVKKRFETEILRRETSAKLDLEAIDNYRITKDQRLKELVNRPVFDIPVQNVEFVKS